MPAEIHVRRFGKKAYLVAVEGDGLEMALIPTSGPDGFRIIARIAASGKAEGYVFTDDRTGARIFTDTEGAIQDRFQGVAPDGSLLPLPSPTALDKITKRVTDFFAG